VPLQWRPMGFPPSSPGDAPGPRITRGPGFFLRGKRRDPIILRGIPAESQASPISLQGGHTRHSPKAVGGAGLVPQLPQQVHVLFVERRRPLGVILLQRSDPEASEAPAVPSISPSSRFRARLSSSIGSPRSWSPSFWAAIPNKMSKSPIACRSTNSGSSASASRQRTIARS
jgi:hypothetical protein